MPQKGTSTEIHTNYVGKQPITPVLSVDSIFIPFPIEAKNQDTFSSFIIIKMHYLVYHPVINIFTT